MADFNAPNKSLTAKLLHFIYKYIHINSKKIVGRADFSDQLK